MIDLDEDVAAPDKVPSRASARAAIDMLGRKIVLGDEGFESGDVLSLDAVSDALRVTRAMAREVTQALSHIGMITMQSRVGATVRPMPEWDLLDRRVIEWCLDSHWSDLLMRSITEMRLAVEPRAAWLAAERGSASQTNELPKLAYRLQEYADDPVFQSRVDDSVRVKFRDIDARLHAGVLAASGNELFRGHTHVVEAAMDHRLREQWHGRERRRGGKNPFPLRPEPVAMWLHIFMVEAIVKSRPRAAETLCRAMLAEVDGELLTDPDMATAVDRALEVVRPAPDEVDDYRIEMDIVRARARLRVGGRDRGPIVFIGVAGCGKTTTARLMAQRLGVPHVEADDLHPRANIAKMGAVNRLTDEDREPWLNTVAAEIAAQGDVVVSCSALKRRYRDTLRAADPRTRFVHLTLDRNTAAGRVTGRAGHFMPAALVDSQFDDLETLTDDERGIPIDATAPTKAIVRTVMDRLSSLG